MRLGLEVRLDHEDSGAAIILDPGSQQARCPAHHGGGPDDHEHDCGEDEGADPPVHLAAERVGRVLIPLDHELGPAGLLKMQMLAVAFDDVGEPLKQVDELSVVYGDRGLAQSLTSAIFDLHPASIAFLTPLSILPHMPAGLALLDDDQRALVQLVREFAAHDARPAAAAYEARGEDPVPLYRQLAELGLTGIPFPEEHGGGGQNYLTHLVMIEELAAAYLALAVGLSVHTLCAFAVNAFGSARQRDEVLTRLASGEWFGAYSLSEPAAGSDAGALATKAVRSGSDYLLEGSKVFCTRGAEADVVLVMARTGEPGARGISAFLVERATEGFAPGAKEDKMGWRSSPTWQLVFDGARVPESRRLGAEGAGFKVALAALDSGRLGIAACAVGLAQAALDAALDYTGEREQFGRPVAHNQGVSFMLADMATQIEAGRALYRRAASLRDGGHDYSLEAAQAKLFCTDAAMRVTTDAVQLHGGYGYITEYPVERFMREAKGLQIVEGTNQIQRLVIGRKLTGG
jgi:alkylation response protein AidB-like acyl-CoA dehydrogenase